MNRFPLILGLSTACFVFGVSGVTAEDAVANDSGVANHWNQSEDWGTVQAAKSSVTFSISKKPASGFVALPRLNNRWKSIAAEGYTGELRFVPEIDHWRIFVPDDLEYPATINMQLIETVRLCEKPFVVEQSKDGSVSLPAHHAETSGEKLRYEPQPHKNTVGYWTVPSDTVTWKFSLDRGETFDVVVHQGCGTGQGGSEVEFAITAEDGRVVQTFPLTIEDTGHFQNFVPRSIGSVALEPGSYSLKVSCNKLAKSAVCDIRLIELKWQD